MAGNMILHATSAHPVNLISSIPYGECLKIKRNCSEEVLMEEEIKRMTIRFQERGYNEETFNISKEQLCTQETGRITVLQ